MSLGASRRLGSPISAFRHFSLYIRVPEHVVRSLHGSAPYILVLVELSMYRVCDKEAKLQVSECKVKRLGDW